LTFLNSSILEIATLLAFRFDGPQQPVMTVVNTSAATAKKSERLMSSILRAILLPGAAA